MFLSHPCVTVARVERSNSLTRYNKKYQPASEPPPAEGTSWRVKRSTYPNVLVFSLECRRKPNERTKGWKCRPVEVSTTDVYFATECPTWPRTCWATAQLRVENGAQRLRRAAGLGFVVAAWGKWAMREDGTSPTCCGFSFQRGCCCCWTRSRRVQPEVSVGRTDSQNASWLLCHQSCEEQLWSNPALHLTTSSFGSLFMKTVYFYATYYNISLMKQSHSFPLYCSMFSVLRCKAYMCFYLEIFVLLFVGCLGKACCSHIVLWVAVTKATKMHAT